MSLCCHKSEKLHTAAKLYDLGEKIIPFSFPKRITASEAMQELKE